MTVTCKKRLAQHVATSLRRGDPVIVTGRLFLREDRDKRLSRVEIEAVSVGVDLNRVVVEVRHGSQVVA
jgi:single-strand DNA-binding protein